MRHEDAICRVALARRILLTLLLVLTITALAGTWELYPLLSPHSRDGEAVSAELVWIEVWRWVAIVITSSVALSAAIALLSFAANRSDRIRTWTWVFGVRHNLTVVVTVIGHALARTRVGRAGLVDPSSLALSVLAVNFRYPNRYCYSSVFARECGELNSYAR